MRLGWRNEGGGRELLALALPFILSNSFWTLQMTIDRVLLSQYKSDAVAAAMPAILLFWTPFALLQNTSNYATTFVAQYCGAGRRQRVGAAVWQSLYFSLAAGIGFLGILSITDRIIALAGHSPEVQILEVTYLNCLCLAALPALIVASVGSFFAGRGDSWTVLWINGVGLVVNAGLDWLWISGRGGFPSWGIAGAGWATVVGNWASALLGLALLFRAKFRAEYGTLSGWRWERDLFLRLMRFGFPNGLQWMLDALAFTVFILIVGRLGAIELAASNVAFTINMVAVLPMLGMGQAVEVLVGQRLGSDQPDIAERTTWSGFALAWSYMALVAILYALVPGMFILLFESGDESWPLVAAIVPLLLRYVALYSLFDSMNLIFSFALRGAGDTRFVTVVSITLAWPLMVLPTWLAYKYEWGLYWAWAFATAYIIALGFTFLLRFRVGYWKSMRVIESAPKLSPEPAADCVAETASV